MDILTEEVIYLIYVSIYEPFIYLSGVSQEDRPVANMPVMTTEKLDCAVEGQRSIKLRFSHGQVTR